MLVINLLHFQRITFPEMEKLMTVEVIKMAKNPKRGQSQTNVEQVKKQNQQAAQNQQGQFSEEFASETDAQQVKKQNQQSQQNKK